MKRFWQEAHVVADAVALDGKPLRTPLGAPLVLPAPALAHVIAAEWMAAPDRFDPRHLVMTGLANVAIDRAGAAMARTLAAYGACDLICYRADAPAALAARQAAAWDPLIDWAARRFSITLRTTAGIAHVAQPTETVARLAEALDAADRWTLAGLHPVVTITGSLVIGLALAEGAIDAAAAWQAGHVDELWQAEKWGEDADAAAARAARRAALNDGARFIALARG